MQQITTTRRTASRRTDGAGLLVILQPIDDTQADAIDPAIIRSRTLVLGQSVRLGRDTLLSYPNMLPVEGGRPIMLPAQ